MNRSPRERHQEGPEPIAIVGASCRLPGGIETVEGLLAALRSGQDLISDVPPERWDVDALYDPDPLTPAKTYVRRGGFVSDIDCFDAGFFAISDVEAARMDPQQRLLLQTVWHALENAGQSPSELEHTNTGVFLAMMNTNTYSQLKGYEEGLTGLVAYDAMADAMSIASGRIAHFLGLEGPAVSIDTACSGSLVALHLARQSILAGDCDEAIVAGVNLILTPAVHIAFSKVGLMSRAGRCAAFDASADGYIRGEGCVAVLLRRQSEAQARGDRILASIVGTAVNQDGRTPAVTAPNGRAQERVMRSAMARLGVGPSEIGYVEAHGTGTPVGDPIEMSAIANVFGPGRQPGEKLYVGSVKSNFGHIEAGAGLLGLLKAALSLRHEQIFPSVHFTRLNPSIDLGHAPIEVPTAVVPWPRSSTPRMAGVNSFGYSGTNAHAILREPPRETAEDEDREARARPNEIVLLSAKSKASLDDLAGQWIAHLRSEETPSLANVAFTAATGRAHLKHRVAAVGTSKSDIAGKLEAWRDGRLAKGLASGQTPHRVRPKVAFMFTGQGAQHAGMGQELYRTEARFTEAIDRVAACMDPHLGARLTDVLFGPDSATYLGNTRFVQPALFGIEYALADLLRHWGVEPDFVIGHSVGELVAGVVAGVLDLEDACRFVVARGRLMGALPEGGRMLAIGADQEQARRWIKGREAEVSIATVNGPQAVVVSGTAAAVEAVGELAAEAGLRTTFLDVSHAFHSPLMDPILDQLAEVAASMRMSPPQIQIVSNVSGDFHVDRIEPRYWSTHVREAVLFHAGMEKIVASGATLLVEIGPHPALTPAVATSFDGAKVQPIPTLKRDGKDLPNLLGAMAALFVNGAAMNPERLFWRPTYQRVALPLYPFRKDRHWVTPTTGLRLDASVGQGVASNLPALPDLHPLLGKAVARSHRRTEFQVSLSPSSPWTDHRVLGSTVFPGTAYLDMAARGFAAMAGRDWCPAVLKDVSFERPLILAYRKPKTVKLLFEPGTNGSGETRFTIAAANGEEEVYCRGRISEAPDGPTGTSPGPAMRDRGADLPSGSFYGELRKAGLEYGARFANVRELWLGAADSGEALGRVAFLKGGQNGKRDPFSNAVLLDGCAHVFGAALRQLDSESRDGAFVPASVQSVRLQCELPSQVWSQAKVTMGANGRGALASVRVTDDAGATLAEFEGLELRHTAALAEGRPAGPSKGPVGAATVSRAELVDLLRPLDRRGQVLAVTAWLTGEIKDTMGQAADGLDLDALPPSTAFLEIGLDSLLVTELQRRIQEKLEFRFQPMQGLDYQTLDSMAEFLLDSALAGSLQREQAATV